jgi:hypothetical protein
LIFYHHFYFEPGRGPFCKQRAALLNYGSRLGKQRRARLRELHVGAALMHPKPAVGDGTLKASLVFRRGAPELIEEQPVELLDMRPRVLPREQTIIQLSRRLRQSAALCARRYDTKRHLLVR